MEIKVRRSVKLPIGLAGGIRSRREDSVLREERENRYAPVHGLAKVARAEMKVVEMLIRTANQLFE